MVTAEAGAGGDAGDDGNSGQEEDRTAPHQPERGPDVVWRGVPLSGNIQNHHDRPERCVARAGYLPQWPQVAGQGLATADCKLICDWSERALRVIG